MRCNLGDADVFGDSSAVQDHACLNSSRTLTVGLGVPITKVLTCATCSTRTCRESRAPYRHGTGSPDLCVTTATEESAEPAVPRSACAGYSASRVRGLCSSSAPLPALAAPRPPPQSACCSGCRALGPLLVPLFLEPSCSPWCFEGPETAWIPSMPVCSEPMCLSLLRPVRSQEEANSSMVSGALLTGLNSTGPLRSPDACSLLEPPLRIHRACRESSGIRHIQVEGQVVLSTRAFSGPEVETLEPRTHQGTGSGPSEGH